MTNLSRPTHHFVATVIDSCGFETECKANSLSRIALEIAATVDVDSTKSYKVWRAKNDSLAGYVTVKSDGSYTYRAA